MAITVAHVAYAYLFIGDLDAIVESDPPTPVDLVSPADGFVRVRTGTHTGRVEVEMRIADDVEPVGLENARTGEAVIELRSSDVFVMSFYGLAEGAELTLPSEWASASVRVTALRWAEAHAKSDPMERMAQLERVVVEFTRSRLSCAPPHRATGTSPELPSLRAVSTT